MSQENIEANEVSTAEVSATEVNEAVVAEAVNADSSDASTDAGDNQQSTNVYVKTVDEQGRAYATGKRKDATARVWIQPGKGRITVKGAIKSRSVKQANRKESKKATKEHDFTAYFARPVLQMIIKQPLVAADRESQFDVVATLSGGGLSGQAGALKHGISKALVNFEPELRSTLKAGGFLTRDARVVERKKYGKRKARRSFQFSKR